MSSSLRIAARVASCVAAFCVPLFASASVDPTLVAGVGRIAVPFIGNQGQYPAAVRFHASTFAGSLQVMQDGSMRHLLARPAGSKQHGAAAGAARGAAFVESFAGSTAEPRGGARSRTNVSILKGEASAHLPDVPAFADVRLDGAFPGVDVMLRATGRNVEKIYTVAPGRDPAAIRMRIDGARALRIAGDGTLVVDTGEGDVSFTAPIAFQLAADGARQPVGVAYRVDGEAREYGFELGAYDRARALVIDPLIKATFLGGGGQDNISAIAIHPTTGDVYVAGQTTSAAANIPPYSIPPALPCVTTATAGCQNGAQTNYGGFFDCFVGRLNAGLTSFIQLTYIGGNQEDACRAIAIAPDGFTVYVAGRTASTTPPVGGGAQSAHSANTYNAFVARLTSSLTSYLAWSYFGGTGGTGTGEDANALAINPLTGDVVVVGQATSTAGLPGVTMSSLQQAMSGDSDAFVARFDASLGTVNATYFGGSLNEVAHAAAFHPGSNDLYVVGESSSAALPAIAKGAQTTFTGFWAGFAARFIPDLSGLYQSTFIGANELFTMANAMAFHPATGDLYVGGGTTASALVGTGSGYQSNYGGNRDAFIAWLDPALKILYRATYYGGNSEEDARAIAIHPAAHEVYIAGYTNGTLPSGTSGSLQSSSNGGSEGFIARFAPDLTMLGKATYYGGNSSDGFYTMAISPLTGNVYAAGGSLSGTLAGATGAAQTTGDTTNGDAIVVAVTADLAFSDITPNAFTFQPKSGVAPGSLQISSPALITGIVDPAAAYITGAPGAAFCISSAATCTCDVSIQYIPAGVNAQISNNRYVCVRHTAPIASPAVNASTLHVGGAAGTFYVATGAPLGSPCTLDVDGNGSIEALTDGLILIRAMLGMTGSSVTNLATGGGATRDTWELVRTYLNGNCGSNFSP
jgi:hypothetical protein